MRRELWQRLRYQVLGLVFLLVAALFITLTLAVYHKAFTPVTLVKLETDRVGSQLRTGGDVKVRGMLVGEVRSVLAKGDHAELELALDPDKTPVIPKNVSARLLPKTLFGERYVALQLPGKPEAPIQAGDVIPQDRSSAAIELQKVLDDVMPLLQAVQPEKLSSTLTAVATALDGRGKQLGETLAGLSDYLGKLNPSLPDVKADITGLANVANTYDKAAPDLLQALSDLTTTSRTIVDQRAQLSDLYATVTAASVDLTSFLQVNKDNLIRLTSAIQPTLDVLAKYAPEYPCLMRQLAESVPRAELAFGKGTAHPEVSRVTIEFAASRGKYLPGVDEPKYEDKRGPRCYPTVPKPGVWPQYPPDGAIKDGSSKPAPPKNPPEKLPAPITAGGGAVGGDGTIVGSAYENDLIDLLASPALGTSPGAVPGWAGLLVGPLYRGTEVELK
ncbi:ABC transporter substrate-binding protein [Amycolatopsis mediterranei S699]|uniref:ABC transport system substrate-binding protein n=2 Tax=Amycolatopsis mediterranei TaxID=33910 RepID=A0A0H3CZZ0_AMYMU|nr:MCE family protein [Amycolatopsis mediterranei]ADJ44224.1 ABC transport system substrate-binding protein [Amycolatopsis mediterranei U32]AEK40960.1 ABC transporter substrate-binding protein [Amycolatopsis mediterranei S699]AFO75937.1 ABC transporter substrate-binding protein [Amycolatopsis mediterranei S699]AGT83066.1 ABC transporter substrate-binding protein [Amycolatopsis mediterranei RB]KDO06859.1 ABC transporter substrate-binding protein [Amycolatopsis mediterranei]